MVLQLAYHVQEGLHKHNKPQLSFYDKMMANKRKEEERILAAEQQKLRKELEANKEREEDEVCLRICSDKSLTNRVLSPYCNTSTDPCFSPSIYDPSAKHTSHKSTVETRTRLVRYSHYYMYIYTACLTGSGMNSNLC